MIIVTGSARAAADHIDELLGHCVEHVRRSRSEPGCLSHAVHRDVEDPLRVFFFEQWEDPSALRAHFAVPASGEFVRAIATLTSEPPTLEIYAAEPASI
ncbi:MAG: putative quinol monooxygenase [Acidimicrobiales bacterium]